MAGSYFESQRRRSEALQEKIDGLKPTKVKEQLAEMSTAPLRAIVAELIAESQRVGGAADDAVRTSLKVRLGTDEATNKLTAALSGALGGEAVTAQISAFRAQESADNLYHSITALTGYEARDPGEGPPPTSPLIELRSYPQGILTFCELIDADAEYVNASVERMAQSIGAASTGVSEYIRDIVAGNNE